MKLRMKKMPRPLDLRRFSGRQRIGDLLGIEALALVEHATTSSPARGRRERELDGHELAVVLAVAVLDGVDDRLADRDADPVDGVLVEAGELTEAIAHDLDEVQHLEIAVDLESDRPAARQHAVQMPAGAGHGTPAMDGGSAVGNARE